MSETRREFLIRVAKGAAYSAPVVRTLTAPDGQFQLGPSAPWTNDP